MRLDGAVELALVDQSDDSLDDLAALEEQQRRNASDAEATDHARILVDIQLSHREASVEIGGNGVDGRGQASAWRTPFCPEVDENRRGRLDHVLLEVAVGKHVNSF